MLLIKRDLIHRFNMHHAREVNSAHIFSHQRDSIEPGRLRVKFQLDTLDHVEPCNMQQHVRVTAFGILGVKSDLELG